MGLDIAVAEVGNGGGGVALRGRLDSETAPLLDERLGLLAAVRDRPPLRHGGREYISSAGIRILVEARKALQARAAGWWWPVCSPGSGGASTS